MDRNGDGNFTISDCWLLLRDAWQFFVGAGNVTIDFLFDVSPGVVRFLELGNASVYHDGLIAVVLSILEWGFVVWVFNKMDGGLSAWGESRRASKKE